MKFSDLVVIDELRGLCESFTALTGAVTAILDLEGNILIATGWQDICVRFHRLHPLTAARCLESDTTLAGQLSEGRSYNVYQCKNGLVDVAVPIDIGGEHVANFFTGQFFFAAPDKNDFLRQAEAFGFDKEAYLAALDKVPIFSEDQVHAMTDFFTRLSRLIGDAGLARAKLENSNLELLKQQTHLEERTRELDEANKQLAVLSFTDSLTRLANRRSFDAALEVEFLRLRRSGAALSLIMLDIDHFKNFNDTYGHVAGDECLRRIGSLIGGMVSRVPDLAARYGGEEFAVILPETDSPGATALAERIRHGIRALGIAHAASSAADTVTASLGVITVDVATLRSPQDLIRLADEQLYLAKSNGRNCVFSIDAT
jgi:diguanylate cyclase (GGDEF)-like protein